MTVHKNTIAATFEPADVIQSVNDQAARTIAFTNSAPGTNVPDHLTDVFNESSDRLCESDKNKLKGFLIEFENVFSKSSSDIG